MGKLPAIQIILLAACSMLTWYVLSSGLVYRLLLLNTKSFHTSRTCSIIPQPTFRPATLRITPMALPPVVCSLRIPNSKAIFQPTRSMTPMVPAGGDLA